MSELVIGKKINENNSCFFVTNEDFQILDFNSSFSQLFNLPIKDFIGKNLLKFLSAKSAKFLSQEIKNSSPNKKWETEIELVTKPNHTYILNVSVIPFSEQSDFRFFFMCKDKASVNENVFPTDFVQKDFDRDTILNSLDCSLWAIDKDFQLIVFNEKFHNIIKKVLQLDIFHGMKIFDNVSQELQDYWIPLHEKALNGEKFSTEINIEKEIIEVSFSPILKNGQIIGTTAYSKRITESKKFQQKLQISEEKYKKLIDNSPMAIFIFDFEKQKIVEVNDSACILFKYTKEELMASTPWNLSPEFQEDGSSSKESVFQNVKDALHGKDLEFEWIHTDSKGSLIPCQVWLSQLPSEHNNTLIRACVLDIRERRNHQAELKEKEERIRTVVNNVPVILWACDKKGNFSFFDGDAKRLLNINSDDAFKLCFIQIFSDSNNIIQLKNLLASENDFSIQINKNNKYFELKAKKLSDRYHSFLGYTGVLVDITGRIESDNKINSFIKHQSELIKRIKQQETNLSTLINSTTDIIISIDNNLNILEFNHTFAAMIKKAYSETVQKSMNLRQFLKQDIKEPSERNIKKALSGKIVKDILAYTSRSGEKIYMSVIYTPIYSDKREVSGITIISRDITESRKAEEQIVSINKQIAEYKLMALRSVMNPHFLFNSLNSIQYFVATNERRNALDYLSVFSTLIRKILHSSVNNTIPLNTELEILNYYIKLEQLRFEDKFNFEIYVDPKIDKEAVEIPSLLIQPYVENAILHGLTNKETFGNLKISVGKEKENLIIIVEDDGIGRERAKKIKNQNEVIHEKSYGMLVTKERLDIINRTADVSVKIEDLTEQGVPVGTRVKIKIKVDIT